MPNDRVVTVRGEDELAVRAGHLFGSPKNEFVCAATDMNTWSRPRARAAIARQMRPAIAGGLVVRKLYTPAAPTDEEQRRHLLELAAVGGQVRIASAELPHEAIIIDRRAMILAGTSHHGDREFTVTTSPTLVDAVHALILATWDSAVELGAYLDQEVPHIDAGGRAVLRALGSGLTDEVAARRMGVSLRTYRRRVAEVMRLLDAESRFQAGARAGELGLIR